MRVGWSPGGTSTARSTLAKVRECSVVVADDNLIVREGLRSLIDKQDHLKAVGACETYEDLLATVDRLEPDVVITDIRMPPTSSDEGIRAAGELRRSHPSVGVIVLSQYLSAEYALALTKDGSEGRGYLLKERVFEPSQLVAAVDAVYHGGSVIDPEVVSSLIAKPRIENPLDALSRRELEVLREIAQGRANSAVARVLFISDRAVEKHINSLFAKLGLDADDDAINRRVQAVLMYLNVH